ncbi:preprotein translocase subunit SecY (plasmid) [Limosilactobacillus reuteri]|uniref:Protein translocase subunit SecY n=1 Tax=Limosilactobacillus reuteri TaxID=1598 RepID=A0A517D8Q7_LIMRT|nr:preprotein translocase subunit SecY [Limosilactobacillus reuteri]QDR73627.1 preprotein translocase subunit SecY [Limosilactobacillus reuteri]
MTKIDKDHVTLVKRVFYTIGILILYRLISFVTIPGVDAKSLMKVSNSTSLTMLSMFSGGGFQTFSILSMGVTAYVTAQIIVQLLQSNVIPKLTEWSKQGQTGRNKLNQLTRWLTLILGFAQSVGVTAGINTMSTGFLLDNSWTNYVVIGMVLTAGTFLAMWMGDQITEKGVGNGVSVIICAGIVSRWPELWNQLMKLINKSRVATPVLLTTLIIGLLLLVLLIVWFNNSERRIPIQYARHETGTGSESFLPFKVNVPGVVPIIFASSILAIPQTILMFFKNESSKIWYRVLANFFTLSTSTGVLIYGLLIIVFTYLYSSIQIEPGKLAENFQRQEAYIPGVYPGNPTANYVQAVLNELALPGSLFLVVISVVPLLISNRMSPSIQLGISGSSLLIVVGVITEMVRQIKGLVTKNEYPGFLNKEYSFKE